MSEGRRARLQKALLLEKGKDTLLAKLRRKFVVPDMPKELQDLIVAAIDELGLLPSIMTSDLEKINKKITKIKKEFYERAIGATETENDEDRDRLGPLVPPMSRHGDGQYGYASEERLPPISSTNENHPIESPTAPYSVYDSENDWGALIAANVHLDFTHQLQAREKAKEDQISMRSDLDMQVQYRKHRIQEDKEMDQYYERELYESLQLAKTKEDEELRLQEFKTSQARNERLKEIEGMQHTRSEAIRADFEQQQKYAKWVQENIMHHRNLHIQEARHNYEEMKKGLQENEEKRLARKERISRELEEERNEMKKNVELYEKMKSVVDDHIHRRKENRIRRTAAVKYCPEKTMAQKAYEDEVKAQQEVEEYERRLKEDELRRIHQILHAQDEVVRSNQEASTLKEEMKKKEKEEKARLGEYWRAENELRKKAEELARKEAHEKSLEYARQLIEQMSSEQARKKKECVSMSEAEKKLNKQIFERAGIFPRDTIQ